MSTFRVSPDELQAFAGRMYNTSSGLFDVSAGGYGEPNSGSPALDRAVAGFTSHWGSTLNLLAQDITHLADKVSGAAKGYAETESSIVQAGSGK